MIYVLVNQIIKIVAKKQCIMNSLSVLCLLIIILASLSMSIIVPYSSYERTISKKTTSSSFPSKQAGISINDTNYLKANVTVNNFNLIADLATSDVQQTKGLAVKDYLQEKEGMLFVFQKPAQYHFWMKDMKFPIDIIWLDDRGTVIHIEDRLQPCLPEFICPSYAPTSSNTLYVLETVAGFSQKHNVKVGIHIDFHLTRTQMGLYPVVISG
jgi:uncharacterized protein